jgi:hypothetical protein
MRAEPFLALTQRAVFTSIRSQTCPLDAWIAEVERCATSKEKGDHFEALCVEYLLHPDGARMVQAWTLPNLPVSIRQLLALPKRDFGIDIVSVDAGGKYHAVQSKFKGRSRRRRGHLRVSWTELSTFLALARLGEYVAHWVMTTADGVCRPGGRSSQDRSVCYKKLKTLPASFWRSVARMESRTLVGGDAGGGGAIAGGGASAAGGGAAGAAGGGGADTAGAGAVAPLPTVAELRMLRISKYSLPTASDGSTASNGATPRPTAAPLPTIAELRILRISKYEQPTPADGATVDASDGADGAADGATDGETVDAALTQ